MTGVDVMGYVPSEHVVRLMEMKKELVHAADIAPICGMHPDAIRGYAYKGEWPRDICNYIVLKNKKTGKPCGAKFFRVDFLRKGGWIK